jgi:sRNA-binding carbon storage regulator CsrA
MLVLLVKEQEVIWVQTPNGVLKVRVCGVRGDGFRIGFEGDPKEFEIFRDKMWKAAEEEKPLRP